MQLYTFIFLVNNSKCQKENISDIVVAIQGKIKSTDIETFIEHKENIDDCLSEFTLCNMWGK